MGEKNIHDRNPKNVRNNQHEIDGKIEDTFKTVKLVNAHNGGQDAAMMLNHGVQVELDRLKSDPAGQKKYVEGVIKELNAKPKLLKDVADGYLMNNFDLIDSSENGRLSPAELKRELRDQQTRVQTNVGATIDTMLLNFEVNGLPPGGEKARSQIQNDLNNSFQSRKETAKIKTENAQKEANDKRLAQEAKPIAAELLTPGPNGCLFDKLQDKHRRVSLESIKQAIDADGKYAREHNGARLLTPKELVAAEVLKNKWSNEAVGHMCLDRTSDPPSGYMVKDSILEGAGVKSVEELQRSKEKPEPVKETPEPKNNQTEKVEPKNDVKESPNKKGEKTTEDSASPVQTPEKDATSGNKDNYLIKPGDNLWKIARESVLPKGASKEAVAKVVAEIVQLNELKNPQVIVHGRTLIIPKH